MTHRANDTEAGFALVESIAVLALAALVFVTLLLATDLVSRNSAAAARRATTMETLMTGLSAVRRDLEGARYIRIGGPAGETLINAAEGSPEPADPRRENPVLFSGSAQSVALAVADDRTGLGRGESLVLIQARYEGDRGALVRSSAQMLPGTMGFGSAKFGNAAVLATGPWRYVFSYADPKAGAERWRSSWTASTRLPAAIRLEVLDRSGGRVVPPLTVRIAIDSAGCADVARTDCAPEEAAPVDQPFSPDPNQGNTGDPNAQ